MNNLDNWFKKIEEYKQKQKLGTLTKEEQEDWDFMEEKLEDWRSDYYSQENY